MKVAIEEVEEPIVIKNRSQPTMQEVEKGASANKVKGTKLDSMYFPIKVVPFALDTLTKTTTQASAYSL